MMITVKTLQLQTFKIGTEETETVRTFKEKIEAFKGNEFPANCQKLIYAGKILSDEKKISEYEIDEKKFVVIMVVKPRSPSNDESSQDSSSETSSQATPNAVNQTPSEVAPLKEATESSKTKSVVASDTPLPKTDAIQVPVESTDDSESNLTSVNVEGLDISAVESTLVLGEDYERMVSQIAEMGYDRDDVEKALKASFNDLDRAVEYLIASVLPVEQEPHNEPASSGDAPVFEVSEESLQEIYEYFSKFLQLELSLEFMHFVMKLISLILDHFISHLKTSRGIQSLIFQADLQQGITKSKTWRDILSVNDTDHYHMLFRNRVYSKITMLSGLKRILNGVFNRYKLKENVKAELYLIIERSFLKVTGDILKTLVLNKTLNYSAELIEEALKGICGHLDIDAVELWNSIYKHTVKVRWGKELYDGIEVCTEEDPIVFKAQLFALTGVQPDRQKVMLNGMTLKDEEWGNIKLKDGVTLLMMGTREELSQAPVEKTRFMEDMSDQELATALEYLPGLTNLGNTCYMNATVQCLKTVPELRSALRRFSSGLASGSSNVPAQSITAALKDLYEAMDRSKSEYQPVLLQQVLHIAFPRFAEKNEHGSYAQQDANECWIEIMRMLQQKLPSTQNKEESDQAEAAKYSSFIDQYFGGTFESTLKCIESETELETQLQESFLQIGCFISPEVKYMLTGLKQRMQETLTKYSISLNRDAQYQKSSKISRLPAYLTIQFLRFFYKEKEAINAKKFKNVKFTLDLDVFELCTKELQAKLTPMRSKFKDEEDKNLEHLPKTKLALDRKAVVPTRKLRQLPYHFEDDIGSNNSGYYELSAVLTHKGRNSSSGHYVAWIKRKKDEWYKCDDETVSMVTSEKILKLSGGGGNWHCAYLLLYGPRVLEVPKEDVTMS